MAHSSKYRIATKTGKSKRQRDPVRQVGNTFVVRPKSFQQDKALLLC